MTRNAFPWRDMTWAEVRLLAFEGFNAHEIATVAGVPDDVGAAMRAEALRVPRESPAYAQVAA